MSAMMWMRMPGQSWPGAAASFLGMWAVMMVAMMLPILIPMLWRYREAVANTGAGKLAWLTALVTVGYFCVWTAFGVAVYPVGVALSAITARQPIAVGATVLIIGLLQFTQGKASRVACLMTAHRHGSTAWRHGLHLRHSLRAVLRRPDGDPAHHGRDGPSRHGCCHGRDWAIERVAPAGLRVPRAIGAVVVGTAMVLIARAVGLG